jgi:hypothetical protein
VAGRTSLQTSSRALATMRMRCSKRSPSFSTLSSPPAQHRPSHPGHHRQQSPGAWGTPQDIDELTRGILATGDRVEGVHPRGLLTRRAQGRGSPTSSSTKEKCPSAFMRGHQALSLWTMRYKSSKQAPTATILRG